jgi:hypothetical protein
VDTDANYRDWNGHDCVGMGDLNRYFFICFNASDFEAKAKENEIRTLFGLN